MSHEDLAGVLQQRPFIPFRVVLTEGTSYEVRHPELFMLGKRSVVIGVASDPQEIVYDRTAMVDLFHIVRIEPLDRASPTGASGDGQ
jgi:hypothetical protein